MSTRLTNAVRDKIIRAAVEKSGFAKRIEQARIDVEVVRAGLPAINFENLNASIGIPSEKK